MKNFSNTEAEMKKRVAYKKVCIVKLFPQIAYYLNRIGQALKLTSF